MHGRPIGAERGLSRKGWLLFAALCIIWGIPYLLIRVAVKEISPATIVFLRTVPAALLLAPLAVRRGQLRPLLRRWHWVLVYTVAELAVPWLLLSRAEEHLSSSLSGLLIAAVPLLGAVLYRFFSAHEPLGTRRLIGLFIGFGGVAALVGIDVGQVDMAAVAEVGVVVLGYTLGPFIISRRLADLPNMGVIFASLVITAVGYAPVALTHLPSRISWAAGASVAGLAVFCTALAFVLFFELIIEVGPARSTVITYINPAVAVLLGVTVLGEPFTIGMAVGLPLVLAGMVLGTSSSTKRQGGPDDAGPPAAPPTGTPA
jgi:drug/metabolite transporter (DMT)-like permease